MITREHKDLTGLLTGASFSDCLLYRYGLWRQWDRNRPLINFLMLNPSTADDVRNDPTVERCERLARSLGAGRLIVTNIFAYRATDPAELLTVDNPVGPQNNAEILKAAKMADIVVCAWGVHGDETQRRHGCDRGTRIATFLRIEHIRLHCLGKTKGGHPRHPLYVAYGQKLEPF